jgi:mycofactocin system transcriptional regulator
VARAALALFSRQGFEATTVDEIASEVGISRRTFFRYYQSKSDAVWGAFDAELARLDRLLSEAPDEEGLMQVLRRAVVETNRFNEEQLVDLRLRMSLIRSVPTLVAHSAVRYEEWCDVVARFAARRLGGRPTDLAPQTLARAALGAAMAAFEEWTRRDDGDLTEVVDQALALLATGFDEDRLKGQPLGDDGARIGEKYLQGGEPP